MRRILLAALTAGALLLGPSPASADRVFITDANDASSRLDIEAVGYSHPDRTVLTMRMHEPFGIRALLGENYVLWLLDTRGDDHPDFGVEAVAHRRPDDRLIVRCNLYKIDGTFISRRRGSRPAPDSVRCEALTEALRGVAEHYYGQTRDRTVFDFSRLGTHPAR